MLGCQVPPLPTLFRVHQDQGSPLSTLVPQSVNQNKSGMSFTHLFFLKLIATLPKITYSRSLRISCTCRDLSLL